MGRKPTWKIGLPGRIPFLPNHERSIPSNRLGSYLESVALSLTTLSAILTNLAQ